MSSRRHRALEHIRHLNNVIGWCLNERTADEFVAFAEKEISLEEKKKEVGRTEDKVCTKTEVRAERKDARDRGFVVGLLTQKFRSNIDKTAKENPDLFNSGEELERQVVDGLRAYLRPKGEANAL